ncbi:MAG: M48 family metallopeptidase [Acidobacteriaceae bacterium]
MHPPTRARFLIPFLASMLVCGAAHALPTPPPSVTSTSAQVAPAAAPSQPTAQPSPAATQSSQPAQSQTPAYTLPPALLAKAITLTRLRTLLDFGGTAWSILVLLLVLALHWPVALRNWAERITPNRWLQGLLFLPPAILFLSLVSLPLDIYAEHIWRAYGLSVQSWPSWTLDQLKSLGLSLVVMTPLLLLLFWLLRASPRKWWLWFWLCILPVIVFAVFISPIWIDPIFNHFSPLQKSDPALTVQLEQLAQHAGLDIPPRRMFLMKASEKVTGLNAYVTGIGATTRIVVWDNTIHKLPPGQILFVVGHEMGHYVLRHIYKGLAFTMAVLGILLWLAYLAVGGLIRRFQTRWAIRAPDDWAALAVVALVFTCIGFLFSPIANSFSRWEEHQADVFGQEAIHGLVANPQIAAQSAFVALGENYLEAPNPNPFVEFWLYSHPSVSRRANFAAHYDPWLPGRRPKYFSK